LHDGHGYEIALAATGASSPAQSVAQT
jgi:hypothetical protein